MAEYHVSAGLFGIYAGTVNKKRKDGIQTWREKSCVTDEAIEAVRDFFVQESKKDGNNEFGYSWDTKDGKTVTLKIEVKEKNG